MNSQTASYLGQASAGSYRRLNTGQAMHLGARGGDLTVLAGRVWLTRRGDLGDHLLEPGRRVRLDDGENAVIEGWTAGEDVTVQWIPFRRSFVGALLAEPLRGAAFLARRLALGFAALARSSAAQAARAQGRRDRGGDSLAS